MTRNTMKSRVFMFLVGTTFLYYQVRAADEYSAEVMVESPVAGNQSFLPVLSSANVQLSVGTVTLFDLQPVADCVVVGRKSSCNCSDDYIWTNNLCYHNSCCSEATCTQDVSHVTPLCIPKVQVNLKGSIQLSKQQETNTCTLTQFREVLQKLNGFKYLNVTYRDENTTADFVAAYSTQFETNKFQNIIHEVEKKSGSVIQINITGMLQTEAPQDSVCYMSSPVLKCSFVGGMSWNGWNKSEDHRSMKLFNGTVVRLTQNCAAHNDSFCMALTLQGVTGMWQGSYGCGFSSGSFRYLDTMYLSVALLPDEILLTFSPLVADCSNKGIDGQVEVNVRASILKSPESYKVWWSYRGEGEHPVHGTAAGEKLVYTFRAGIRCKPVPLQYVDVTFENKRLQVKSGRVNIPVLYRGDTFCNEETLNGRFWPKTPSGATVINQTCVEGRIGYMSRTCEGNTWWSVVSFCVTLELHKLLKDAQKFLMGMGSDQEAAMEIFTKLNNCTRDFTENSTADIRASINILRVMSRASANITIGASVLPELVSAASNVLIPTWGDVNASIVQSLAANYLESVEGLVKNIQTEEGYVVRWIYTTPNMELKICSGSNCNMSVFGIDVSLNNTYGVVRSTGIKHLTDKLYNNFPNKEPISLMVSVTLEEKNRSSVEIRMDFPGARGPPLCVFWNASQPDWDAQGCVGRPRGRDHAFCKCDHLTSFSVLMSRGDASSYALDLITYVGLSVSAASLLVFFMVEVLVWPAVVQSNLSLFRHTAIINIAVFLLLGDCSFLASSSPGGLGDTGCLVLTLCKHLFYLATFTWTLCLSMMLIHQLIFVFSPLRKTVFMLFSGVIGYICPVLIVVSSYMYCTYTRTPYYDKRTCWLVYAGLLEGSLYAFVLPVGTIVFINLFSLVVVSLTLTKSSVPDDSKADNQEKARSIMKAVALLTPVFGVTWAIGFLLQTLEDDSPMMSVASYSFTVLNSFQGLFILIMGCFAEKKIRDELMNRIMPKTKGKHERMKSLNSTKDK